ncbi:GntR family transcriptional regulator [Plantactinospora sp. WMMB782]|uniref:GntR family transcriptional regulator n=1 Tax=Plantactinospora sp. WMMB782 TaxID=3404121 RepID=UPI003B964862
MTIRTPDYLRIVNGITEQIRSGELAPGDKLPTYGQLAEHYKVGLSTAQAALRVLRERGFIESHPGKGTYVAENPPQA